MQQAIIDGMTKYAEQKFGRKRAAPKSSKGARSAMDDYEIYLRSLRSKVKTSQDKLNIVNKQKRVSLLLLLLLLALFFNGDNDNLCKG